MVEGNTARTPVFLNEFIEKFKIEFYNDDFQRCEKMYKELMDKLNKNLVFRDDKMPLNQKSEEIQNYFKTDEMKCHIFESNLFKSV